MDPIQWNPYYNYMQTPTGDGSQNFQSFMYPRPPLPNNVGSQYPQSFMSQNPRPYMFQSPPLTIDNDSQNPRPFIFQPPSVELESPIESTTDSQVPVYSTQVGLENVTFMEEGERSSQKKHRFRFSDEEDKLLIQTWLNISKDPVVGVDQKADSFWGRIKDGYDQYRGRRIAREWSTIKSRWHFLNRHCHWFCGSYQLAVTNKKSGQSEADIMDDAHMLFVQVLKTRLTMEKAWRLLKDEPKWKGEAMNNSSKRSKTSSTGTYSSASNPENPIDCLEYNNASHTDRPMGQKAAKRKGKGKTSPSTTPIVDLSSIENVSEKKLDVYNKIAEARLAESILGLYEIIMKDKSKMDDEQRRGHEEVCKSIK